MQPREVLFIIELICWVPMLATAIYVATKQGFSKQLGWFSLCLLGFFRILGAATGIAAINNPTEGLVETSMISASVGLISLVGALTGITFRVQLNLPPAHCILGPFTARLVHLATIAALILSILAGTDFASTNSASDQRQGKLFIKVAVGLLSGILVVVGSIAVFTRTHQMGHIVAPGEPRLVTVTVIALPFIAVRLIYGWLGSCLPMDSIFSLFASSTSAIIARAFMQIAMELLVAGLFLWAGCTVPKSQRVRVGKNEHNSGFGGPMRQTRGGKYGMLRQGFGGFTARNIEEPQPVHEKAATNVQEV